MKSRLLFEKQAAVKRAAVKRAAVKRAACGIHSRKQAACTTPIEIKWKQAGLSK